jgi:negative regulator of genetic competence, sporulation and motility
MELLRINESKLKIMLSLADMEKYRLDGESMDYDNTETRSALWQILDLAKQKTGFDGCGDKLFIQVYPSRGGGCEMYVTKVGEGGGKPCLAPISLVRGTQSIYRFESVETLLSVCKKLKECGYTDESAAYAKEGAYYLVIREKLQSSIMSVSAISEYSFIEEYGTRKSGGIQLALLREHGLCIEEENAIEKLAAL